jgi:8-oxo-dGTP pyrophosphatase MutT (NUDIX family)
MGQNEVVNWMRSTADGAPAIMAYPGEWKFPGGRVEPGESKAETARRELCEEVRERERERDRETETERQRERQTGRETERQREADDGERERERERDTERDRDRETERQRRYSGVQCAV